MPTYEFRCKSCEERFEITRSITEDGTPKCPTCGKAKQVVKVFPKVGIAFKGSGFYKNDSRGGSSKSSSDGGKETSKDGSSSSSDSSSSSSSSSSSTSTDKASTSKSSSEGGSKSSSSGTAA